MLDVHSGEIEVMDSADYLARFHPPPRATTDCSENPGQPCKILLDGEVVGEGRWLRIIGFIEFDQAASRDGATDPLTPTLSREGRGGSTYRKTGSRLVKR